MVKTPNSLLIRISKIISNFFNPLTSLFIFFMYRSSLQFTIAESALLFLPIFLITILPISAWIIWNVKKGKYTNLDVSDRVQRKTLYVFIAVSLIAYVLYDYYFNKNIDLIMVFILVLLMFMQISNYFIKSSMHTAFNVFVAALFLSIHPVFGMVWFIIAVLVGISRIILKRHSPKEVLSGTAIAVLVSFIYLYANIQIQ